MGNEGPKQGSIVVLEDEIRSGRFRFPANWRRGRIKAQAAFLSFPSAIVITDMSEPDHPIALVNPAFSELTGYGPDEVIGRNCRFLQGPETDVHVVTAIREAVAAARPIRCEILNYRKDGTQFWNDLSINPILNDDGVVVGHVAALVDVSARKRAEAERLEAASRLSVIVDTMPGYVFRRLRKPDGEIEYPYLSASFSRLIGHPEGAVTTSDDLLKHMHPDDIEAFRRGVERSARDLSRHTLEFRLKSEQGEERWFRSYSQPRRLPNGDVSWDGVGVDVTREKSTELRLTYLAHHDPVTQLANRTALVAHLVGVIKETRELEQTVALSKFLLTNFSEINETIGRVDGDKVLKRVAARLNELTILDPNCVVARIEGAEFAVLRRGPDTMNKADEFADMILRAFSQPVLIGGTELTIEPCIGTASFDIVELGDLTPEAAATELMKRASIALSAATRSGSGSRRVYDATLDHRAQNRMILRHSLRGAIERNEFVLHYQPLVELRTGRIVSAEALVRWQHPELGLLLPAVFIPLAEESGSIGVLGRWILKTAMQQMKTWKANGLDVPKVAVNISAVQIKLPDFVETVRSLLIETGADARDFELELTESALLEHSPETLAVFVELRLLGFSLVIDDFGAGHASFQYLRNLPIDKIKIDQAFVRQLSADSSDGLIVQTIASLARSLKLALVAEGVETAEQRDFLRNQGCDTGQGYFFSLPLAAEDFALRIKDKVVLPISTAKSGSAGVALSGERRAP
jgi:PAS domain S-box-containing protein/diguanylate cyclase (GGDEF)-like protein